MSPPPESEFSWFIHTIYGIYALRESGEIVEYLVWTDLGVFVDRGTELLFPHDGEIIGKRNI